MSLPTVAKGQECSAGKCLQASGAPRAEPCPLLNVQLGHNDDACPSKRWESIAPPNVNFSCNGGLGCLCPPHVLLVAPPGVNPSRNGGLIVSVCYTSYKLLPLCESQLLQWATLPLSATRPISSSPCVNLSCSNGLHYLCLSHVP